jgi:hypothetical protein
MGRKVHVSDYLTAALALFDNAEDRRAEWERENLDLALLGRGKRARGRFYL